jgi:hypothetical protein
MGKKLLFWLILLMVGFLAGFIPQYSKSRELARTASGLNEQVRACKSAEEFSRIREAAGMMYLAATQKNYGIATGYATRMFDQAQSLAGSTQDGGIRNLLRDVLAQRDQITADLAKGSDAVISEMQPILSKLEQDTKP